MTKDILSVNSKHCKYWLFIYLVRFGQTRESSELDLGHDQKNNGVQKPGNFYEVLQKLGEAASGKLCVGLITALCEGPGKAEAEPNQNSVDLDQNENAACEDW